MSTRIATIAVVGAVTLAACGGGAPADPVGADGVAVTTPALAEGPIPDLPVTPEAAAASPLPQVTVRRINGDGGFVQLKNELPADRPLLVWFWAPH